MSELRRRYTRGLSCWKWISQFITCVWFLSSRLFTCSRFRGFKISVWRWSEPPRWSRGRDEFKECCRRQFKQQFAVSEVLSLFLFNSLSSLAVTHQSARAQGLILRHHHQLIRKILILMVSLVIFRSFSPYSHGFDPFLICCFRSLAAVKDPVSHI